MTASEESRTNAPAAGSCCPRDVDPASQDLRPHWLAGQRVRGRSTAWTIARVALHGRVTALDLDGPRGRLTLLHPFDRFSPLAGASGWKRRRLSVVASRVLDAVLTGTPLGALRGGGAALALPGWQFEPARAFTEGTASRVLLADAVGLGKTIQAGFSMTALLGAGSLAHALVLAPAGLRDQWAAELDARLGLRAWTADPSTCRTADQLLPPGVSPWFAHPLVVTSIDYAKQPDVLAVAATVPWDLVIVDEAHNASTGSDRRVAAHALASRASRVLLVTATPHAGEDEAFASLCAIGAADAAEGPPLVIRRSRREAGLPPAGRLRIVRVPRSPAERALHEALEAYAAQVVAEQRPGAPLAMAWLMKRAASSPEALRRSAEHRSALLSAAGGPPVPAAPWLPFDDEVDEHDDRDEAAPAALACAGLGNRDRELRLLHEISDLASQAVRAWQKGDLVSRWLARSREPVVLFTEYRATLEALLARLPDDGRVAVLHGGLGRSARAEALARFLDGRSPWLLATDVAGEGLNLQAGARTVVSIEMPWTPSRLEQRIGRVERIGQARPVRAACLVSRGGPEERVAAVVAGRTARSRGALPDRDGVLDELSLLVPALGEGESHARRDAPQPALAPAEGDAESDATPAHAWLLRSAARRADRIAAACSSPRVPWTRLRPRDPRDPLRNAVVMVFQAQVVAASGRPVAEAAVALVAGVRPAGRHVPPARLLRALGEHLAPYAARAAAHPLSLARAAFERRTYAEIARLGRMASADAQPRPVQPGLFDRRAITEAAQREVARAVGHADRDRRTARLEGDLAAGSIPRPVPVAAFLCW